MADQLSEVLLDTTNVVSSQTGRLGRLPAIDFRDRRHLMAAKRTTRTTRYWDTEAILDQGATSQCVAFAWTCLLKTGPVKNTKALPECDEIYRMAQSVDEFPDDVPYDGTSVRAGAKVLQQLGYLGGYVWAESARQVANFVLSTGPVVLGTDWLEEMLEADANGFIRAKGESYGGHAYCVVGVNTELRCPGGTVGALRIANSWGTSWGDNGRAWLSLADADLLIKHWGEAAAPKEVKKPV